MEARIELRMAERGQAIEGRLAGAERALAGRIEEALADAITRAEVSTREHSERAGEVAISALGEKFSATLERELKAALERQSAALAAASLHHRRALEKTNDSRLDQNRGAIERSLEDSIGARLAEVQAVIESQAISNAERLDGALAGGIATARDELEASNASALNRLTGELRAEQSLRHSSLVTSHEEALAGHRDELERSNGVLLEEHKGGLEAKIGEQLAAAEQRLGQITVTVLKEQVGAQAEKISEGLDERIEARLRDTRAGLEQANVEALAAAERRVIERSQETMARLASDSIGAVEAGLDGRVSALRRDLTSELERSQAELQTRLEQEVEARIAEARTALQRNANERVDAGLLVAEGTLAARVDEQVRSSTAGLAERLESGTQGALESHLGLLRTEAEARASDGEQRARVAATETMRSELVAQVEAELARLTKDRDAQFADQGRRVTDAAEKARAEIEDAREQVHLTARSLERRARRHELKLVRKESTGRVEAALEKLETRTASVLSELDQRALRAGEQIGASAGESEQHRQAIELKAGEVAARLDAAREQMQASEARVADALGRIEAGGDLGDRAQQALRRMERAIGDIESARTRVLGVERRVGEAELQVRKVGQLSDQASAVELRIRRANEAEADAAAKITDAERRLANLIDG
jgi:hypothetical protein